MKTALVVVDVQPYFFELSLSPKNLLQIRAKHISSTNYRLGIHES